MSHTRIVIKEEDGKFILRTERGFVIGPRLITVDAEKGKQLPGMQDKFDKKIDADRAALAWNTYLLYAWKKRSKSKARSAD